MSHTLILTKVFVVILAAQLVTAGCADDCTYLRLVDVTASHDSIRRGSEHRVVIQFAEPAFMNPDSFIGPLVRLDDTARTIGYWDPHKPEPFDGAIYGVEILDPKTINVCMMIDADNQSDIYVLTVIGDIDSCDLPMGVVELVPE